MAAIPLSEVLNYDNQLVIRRFKAVFPEKAEQADDLWVNMLKYLWLCKKHESDAKAFPHDPNLQFTCVMHQEMRDMDEMWHAFILITKDYADFCYRYFGEFLHHVPNVREEIPQTAEEFEAELHLYLSYVYDNLGADTVRSWFASYL